jgi:hypothetical protein
MIFGFLFDEPDKIFWPDSLENNLGVKKLGFALLVGAVDFYFSWYLVNEAPVMCSRKTANKIILTIKDFVNYNEWVFRPLVLIGFYRNKVIFGLADFDDAFFCFKLADVEFEKVIVFEKLANVISGKKILFVKFEK